MSSCNYLAILVYLQLSTAIIGHESFNASCVQFDESKLADVLHLIREPAVNTVEMILTVASANRTRVFPEMKWPWANEIGRTLISLTSRAKASFLSSNIFTCALEVSMERVSIEVTEETIGCLSPGKKGSDQVFTDLLKTLFLHIEDEDKSNYYKLCRPHDIEGPVQFNCCRVTGGSKLIICADYSSIVLDFAVAVSIAAVAIFCPMILPVLLQHIATYEDKTFYKTSYSHMSLTSVVSMILFEGNGPVKSIVMRGLFVFLTFALFYPADFLNNWIFRGVFIAWATFFCLFELIKIKWPDLKKKKAELNVKQKQVSTFTIPLSLPFDFYEHFKSEDKSSCSNFCKNFWIFIAAFFLLLISPLPLLAFSIKFVLIDFIFYFIFPYAFKCDISTLLNIIDAVLIRPLTLLVIGIFAGSILIICLSTTVGLILNGEFFNPFFAPVLTLIIYFWKNWQFSVEAQCLQLKTSIIDVCKEKAKMDDAVDINEEILEIQDKAGKKRWEVFLEYFCSCTYVCRSPGKITKMKLFHP